MAPSESLNFTPASHRPHRGFTVRVYLHIRKLKNAGGRRKGRFGFPRKGDHMFLGMEWYWWLIIVIILILSVPLKIKFMNWWGRRTKEKKENQKDKWGDEA